MRGESAARSAARPTYFWRMASSPAFARLKRALLRLLATIPAGRVIESAELAAALNVPARHAAYILSKLSDDERALTPWHRVVPRGGMFRVWETEKGRLGLQIRMLGAEGISVNTTGAIAGWPAQRWSPPDTYRVTIWADETDPP